MKILNSFNMNISAAYMTGSMRGVGFVVSPSIS